MATITFNDFAPEMLASARRGPFAEPTASERVEYLVTRLRTERTRLDYENFALEHVLSYQRRIAATKDAFMTRGKLTPLGIPSDWCLHLPSYIFVCMHACEDSAPFIRTSTAQGIRP